MHAALPVGDTRRRLASCCSSSAVRARRPRRSCARRALASGVVLAAAALCTDLHRAFAAPRSTASGHWGTSTSRSAKVRSARAALAALTVDELKSYLREKGLKVDGVKASGAVQDMMLELIEQAEKDIEARVGTAGVADGAADAANGFGAPEKAASDEVAAATTVPGSTASPEALFAELSQLDPQIQKEDYYFDGSWDLEGLEDDMMVAKARKADSEARAEQVGGYVLAEFPTDGNWYYGKVVRADGQDFVVSWDEPDEGEPESKVGKDLIIPLPALAAGDRVKCVWEEDGGWYDGVLQRVNGDGTFAVKYDEDGLEATLGADKVRKSVPPPMYWNAPLGQDDPAPAVGDTVEAYYKDNAEHEGWYSAVVKKDVGDGTFEVEWVEDPSLSVVPRADVKRRSLRIPVEEFTPGQRARGVVTNIPVNNFGAFVDFGASLDGSPKDGLVHKSKMAAGFVETVSDVVRVGQVVDVFFDRNDADGKVGLSMVEGKVTSASGNLASRAPKLASRAPKDFSGFVNVSPEVRLKGVVKGVQQYGVFVEVSPPGGGTPPQEGFVHVGEISEDYVEDATQEVSIGQEVDVCVKSVDLDPPRLSLSMKAC